MEKTVKQLKNFRVDALYGKKRHYNAADRKTKYAYWTSITLVVLNALTSTALVNVVFGEGTKKAEITALVLAVLATITVGLKKTCDFEKQAAGNRAVADAYLKIGKNISLTLSLREDGILSNEMFTERADSIMSSINETNELGTQFPTSNADYKAAKKGIDNGEEYYTEDELNLWE
ncbi:hypothetical protein M2145_001034 [Lachnospiraceae bacterium PF1-21]|uniref:SLATT domain-containing protein n=1 Tax=Ohessyouella blattaphilus TaxID=2949333 RepID=UPI003E194053